jgi:hypothetical protein
MSSKLECCKACAICGRRGRESVLDTVNGRLPKMQQVCGVPLIKTLASDRESERLEITTRIEMMTGIEINDKN